MEFSLHSWNSANFLYFYENGSRKTAQIITFIKGNRTGAESTQNSHNFNKIMKFSDFNGILQLFAYFPPPVRFPFIKQMI